MGTSAPSGAKELTMFFEVWCHGIMAFVEAADESAAVIIYNANRRQGEPEIVRSNPDWECGGPGYELRSQDPPRVFVRPCERPLTCYGEPLNDVDILR